MSRRERERRDVAAPQQLGVTPPPAAPHGTHRVDHVLGPEAVASREARLTGGATAQRPAHLEQPWAGRAMDRTVHPAAAQECRIGRVHDCIHGLSGDVALHRFDRRHAPPPPGSLAGPGARVYS